MGYRSYGRMVFEGEKDVVIALVADLKLRGDEVMHKALDEMVLWVRGERANFGLEYSGWKWYDSYPHIQAFECIWSTFKERFEGTDDEAPDLNGAFIRVGEDDDDIDRRYFGDDPYDLATTHVGIEGLSIPPKNQDIRNTGGTTC